MDACGATVPRRVSNVACASIASWVCVGANPVLVLGLAADHTGHAWVELDGTAVLEPSPPRLRFQELMRFGADGSLFTASDGARTADV